MNGNSRDFSTPNIQFSESVVFTKAQTAIDAPAAVVFRALRNTDTWRDWNRWIPKVEITYQPPDTDKATAAEIQHLVRNTSIQGSFYSDLTDGGHAGHRPRSPDEQPPPRFRLNSISSQMSEDSGDKRQSESVDPLDAKARSSVSSDKQQEPSAAQKFQAAQEARRASIASGKEPEPVSNHLRLSTDSQNAHLTVPNSPGSKRRGSKQGAVVSSRAAERAYQSLMAVYGEPSVRLQVGTKMTFFVRMKPHSPSEYSQIKLVVQDVSRPDDPVTEKDTTALTRSKTHNLERSGKYRVVWVSDSEGASYFNFGDILRGTQMPKNLLLAERVHEIEPTGPESCVYTTWELQKGKFAKTVKKRYGDYLQKMFEVWVSGMRDFCEGLHAPKIDRRDFSISADEAPIVIQTLT